MNFSFYCIVSQYLLKFLAATFLDEEYAYKLRRQIDHIGLCQSADDNFFKMVIVLAIEW